MKFATVLLTFLTAFMSTVFVVGLQLESRETNAQRMARGLSPLPPANLRRRGTPVLTAKRSKESETIDPRCPNGTVYCCENIKTCEDKAIGIILGLLGFDAKKIGKDIGIGRKCDKSPVGATCSKTLSCCRGQDFDKAGITFRCRKIEVQQTKK